MQTQCYVQASPQKSECPFSAVLAIFFVLSILLCLGEMSGLDDADLGFRKSRLGVGPLDMNFSGSHAILNGTDGAMASWSVVGLPRPGNETAASSFRIAMQAGTRTQVAASLAPGGTPDNFTDTTLPVFFHTRAKQERIFNGPVWSRRTARYQLNIHPYQAISTPHACSAAVGCRIQSKGPATPILAYRSATGRGLHGRDKGGRRPRGRGS